MHACSHTDDAVAFALGQLGDGEAAQFQRHMGACAACRLKVSEVSETMGLLAAAAPVATPPPGLKEKVVRNVAAEARREAAARSKRRWAISAWAGAVAAVALVLSSYALLRLNGLQAGAHQTAAEIVVNMVGTEEAPGAGGRVMVLRQGDTTRIALQAHGLPPLQPGEAYQLWLIKDGRRTSGGVFVVDGAGKGGVTAWLPGEAQFDALGITREPDALGLQPRGKKVMGSAG